MDDREFNKKMRRSFHHWNYASGNNFYPFTILVLFLHSSAFSQAFSTQWSLASLSPPPDLWPWHLWCDYSDFVGLKLTVASLLLAVCSTSPRPVLQDSSVPSASAQTGPVDPKPSAAEQEHISPQHQAPVERAPKKQLSFVLENEKQQWRQTVRKTERVEKECKPMTSVCSVISQWLYKVRSMSYLLSHRIETGLIQGFSNSMDIFQLNLLKLIKQFPFVFYYFECLPIMLSLAPCFTSWKPLVEVWGSFASTV